MRSKTPILLVLLGLILASGIGWLLFSDPSGETLAVANVDDTERPQRVEPAAEPSKLAAPEVKETTRDTAPVPEHVEPPRPKAISHKESHWVEGRVVFPNNTPADERVTVVARGKKFKGKTEDSKSYEATVEQNGRFRVAFAKGTRRGKLTIEAKYLYLDKSVKITSNSFDKEAVIEPKLGGCIDIQLTSPNNVPLTQEEIDGIEFQVGEDSNFRFMPTSAEHVEGSLFRVTGVEAGPKHNVGMSSNHFVSAEKNGVDVGPGELVVVEIPLELGASISGRVVGADGESIGAVLIAYRSQTNWDNGMTDEEGFFRKGGLAAGSLTLNLDKGGYFEVNTEEYELVLGQELGGLQLVLTRGNSVRGLVTWPDGSPAAGANVLVKQERQATDENWYNASEELTGTAEADGTFEITGLGPEKCEVSVRAKPELEPIEGESSAKRKRRMKVRPEWHARFDEVVPDGSSLTYVLHAGSGVRGTVKDDRGQVIESFRVVANPDNGNPWSQGKGGRVTLKIKDSVDGAFQLEGLKEGEFEVFATAKGHKTLHREPLTVPSNGAQLELILPRVASVSGVVLDLDGNPLEGARVRQDYLNKDRNFYFGRSDEEETTDEDGVFKFDSLAAGEIYIQAEASQFAGTDPMQITLAPGQNLENVTLAMRVPGSISGSVHASAGAIANLKIHANASGRGNNHETTTDASGNFHFEDLGPATYNVSLEPDMSDVDSESDSYWTIRQARSEQQQVELKEGEHLSMVLGAPSGTPIVVTGRVTQGGEPVADQLIEISRSTENDEFREVAHTEANGTYSMTVDGPGQYTFTVGEGWGSSVRFSEEVPDGEAYQFDIALPTSRLTGTIRGSGAEPLKGMMVSLEPVRGKAKEDQTIRAVWANFRSSETDENGNFAIENLAEGEYTLRVGGGDLWGRQTGNLFGRRLITGITIEEGKQPDNLEITLRPAGSVKGLVLDSSGSPASGVTVRIENEEGLNFSMWSMTRTDSAGRFVVRGLEAGRITLLAGGGDNGSGRTEVEIYEEGMAEVEIALR